MQMQDFALPRQEIVLDIEPLHCFQVAAQYGDGNEVCDRGRLVVPSSISWSVCQSQLQICLSARTTATRVHRDPSTQ